MLEYLSEEWIAAADAALRASGLCSSGGERFVVEQHVGEVVFHIVFDGTGARICSGPAVEPTVVFYQERRTAVRIAIGDLSAEEAVLDGEVVFKGNPMALLAYRGLLDKAEDVFADLRTRTTWDK
ncbi:MAG: hypothetical protein OXE04_06450 [bacterium]|nr:hypothetical protein [bacterium]